MRTVGACLVALLGALWIAPPALGARRSRITITVPAQVKKKTVYDVTIQGFARRRAIAYLFLDYNGCAKSFTGERQRAGKAHRKYAVHGTFAKVSGWNSSTAGIDHACAYLIGPRSGKVIASRRVAFRIR
jgi:hypothetical protein